ncbi:MAG: hypothetical protein U0414_35940 [Polyangiaceae bacterium]
MRPLLLFASAAALSGCFLFDASPSTVAQPTPSAMSASELLQPSSTPLASTVPPDDRAAAGAAAPSGHSTQASAASDHKNAPAPFDPVAFVGRGAANAAPDAFLPYPKTRTRETLHELGVVEEDPPDEDGPDPLVTVYPNRPTSLERVRVYYGKGTAVRSVTIRIAPTADARQTLLDLRAELERRYGKGTLRPEGATEADFDRVLWRTPRLRLAQDDANVEVELTY